MSGQSGGQRLQLSTLNETLTCKICGGYYIDATTIIECLHSFCKSCIVKHLETNKFCPVCNIQVHKNKPLLNIRPDQTLQDVVYKLVPGCYQNEMRYRKDFYAKNPDEKNKGISLEARGEPAESYIYSPDESLSLSLEYYNPEATEEIKIQNNIEPASKQLPRRYLRCPAAVTVFHLQKLIRAKYGLTEAHRIDIMYKDQDKEEPLCASYTLMDVMYIYHWKRKVPLHLSYRIFESASKRIKLSDDNDEFKQSLSNSNMEFESNDDEQSIKREWKEVQLKISETGVMSVTDISSLDTKKSTKANEIKEQSTLEQGNLNACNVSKTVIKTEEKEKSSIKLSATLRGKKVQQDSLSKKSEKIKDEKQSTVSTNAVSSSQNNCKKEIELKSTNQAPFLSEISKKDSETITDDSSIVLTDIEKANNNEKPQAQSMQQSQDKIKIESSSGSEKSTETKQNLSNNNIVNNESKTDSNNKQNPKSSEIKTPSNGSKINALSAKLQFQPKVGQVNNTYSKKSTMADKKAATILASKSVDEKPTKTSVKTEIKVEFPSSDNDSKGLVGSMPPSCDTSTSSYVLGATSVAATYVTASSGTTETSASTSSQQKQNSVLHPLTPTVENLASMGLHVSTSQVDLNNWIADHNAVLNTSKNSPSKSLTVDQQLRSLPGMPQIGKDIVCSTTSGSPVSSMGRFSIQTPSMSIYSITTSMKNNAYTNAVHSYSTPSKQTTGKSTVDVTSMYPVPPCPDAIPISLMKPANVKKDTLTKGTTLNEICAKISNAGTGSKINNICAKIGESSKEKNKVEAQRGKPEVPDLLKISKKGATTSNNDTNSVKHIPNIPNVPIYTPSNSQMLHVNSDMKDNVKRLTTGISPTQTSIMTPQMQKLPTQKKSSQAVGYKTLRDPPKSWNPTLSKNNYVAAKNQAKEMQNQAQASYGAVDGNNVSKQIASKPAKIFKIRNMPRYLGNPSSGVKPMYGVGSEQTKEKDQSSSSRNNPTTSMMKIDPQTLSPIVSSPNSPIVSPPPYSPTARSYPNSPFNRSDICRNNNSPISPRNSPVNMLSTNPFIPSHTPNTNPRLIYSNFSPFAEATSRFSNPLIRSPIGIPPPSAFHSSLPPSINKLYQRSSYLTQPQASASASFSPAVAAAVAAGQPPSVQRIPPSPSSHTSPTPPLPVSSPSSKSPKASTKSPVSQSAANINLSRSDILTATSPSQSVVDSVALQLAKGLAAQRDLNIFDLTRVESCKSNSESGSAKQKSASPPQPTQNKSNDANTKSKSSPSQKISTDSAAAVKQNDTGATERKSDLAEKISVTNQTTKELDKKDNSVTSINGNVKVTTTSDDKLKDKPPTQHNSTEKSTQNKVASNAADNTASSVLAANDAMHSADSKQNSDVQVKKEIEVIDSGKTANTGIQGKKIVEAQKGKVES